LDLDEVVVTNAVSRMKNSAIKLSRAEATT